jgi:hypothetical protein
LEQQVEKLDSERQLGWEQQKRVGAIALLAVLRLLEALRPQV